MNFFCVTAVLENCNFKGTGFLRSESKITLILETSDKNIIHCNKNKFKKGNWKCCWINIYFIGCQCFWHFFFTYSFPHLCSYSKLSLMLWTEHQKLSSVDRSQKKHMVFISVTIFFSLKILYWLCLLSELLGQTQAIFSSQELI